MKLLVKQRVFSWTDSYDVYDENENAKYFVKAEFLSLGHRLHVYDMAGNELGLIKEKVMSLLPVFEIEVNGQTLGRIEKRFTLFRPKYDVEFNGWHVEGDFMGWNYDIYEACSPVVHITKELLHWGDTYVLDFANPAGLRPRRICFFTGGVAEGSSIHPLQKTFFCRFKKQGSAPVFGFIFRFVKRVQLFVCFFETFSAFPLL